MNRVAKRAFLDAIVCVGRNVLMQCLYLDNAVTQRQESENSQRRDTPINSLVTFYVVHPANQRSSKFLNR
jgi:hypothetical protein